MNRKWKQKAKRAYPDFEPDVPSSFGWGTDVVFVFEGRDLDKLRSIAHTHRDELLSACKFLIDAADNYVMDVCITDVHPSGADFLRKLADAKKVVEKALGHA